MTKKRVTFIKQYKNRYLMGKTGLNYQTGQKQIFGEETNLNCKTQTKRIFNFKKKQSKIIQTQQNAATGGKSRMTSRNI